MSVPVPAIVTGPPTVMVPVSVPQLGQSTVTVCPLRFSVAAVRVRLYPVAMVRSEFKLTWPPALVHRDGGVEDVCHACQVEGLGVVAVKEERRVVAGAVVRCHGDVALGLERAAAAIIKIAFCQREGAGRLQGVVIDIAIITGGVFVESEVIEGLGCGDSDVAISGPVEGDGAIIIVERPADVCVQLPVTERIPLVEVKVPTESEKLPLMLMLESPPVKVPED